MPAVMKVGVSIATAGRADILPYTLASLRSQSRLPDMLVICPADSKDVNAEDLSSLGFPVRVVTGARGLTAQRNATLGVLDQVDIILFVDDDFILGPRFIENMVEAFEAHSDVIMLTGHVLADGKKGPGLDPEKAISLVNDAAQSTPHSPELVDVFNGYGCNMAFRWSTLKSQQLRFDETLPLYSWLEDVDFSRQAARFGRLAMSNALCGAHLGTKRGRTSGLRFGYSQIANQIYLVRKGTVQSRMALVKVAENILANVIGSIWPEAYIDRRGRLLGNLRAVLDIMFMKISPLRVLDL